MQLWWFVDQMLEDLSGESLTFQQIVAHIKTHPGTVYDTFTQRFREIAKTLLS